MFANYGLVDPRDNQFFYIGVAEDVYARFIQHLRCDGSNPNKDARIQEMKAANVMVAMPTLQLHDTVEQAKKREAYWIRHYYDLGMPLTNQLIPRYKDNFLLVHDPLPAEEESRPRLRSRMPLEEQREYIFSLLDQGMTRRKIIANVDGFIHPSVIDAVITESVIVPPLEAEIAPESRLAVVSISDSLVTIPTVTIPTPEPPKQIKVPSQISLELERATNAYLAGANSIDKLAAAMNISSWAARALIAKVREVIDKQ